MAYPEIPLPSYGFSGQSIPAVLRTTLVAGLELNRARYGSNRRERRASWSFTAEEFATFRSWFLDDLAKGSLFFDAPWDSSAWRFVGGKFDANHEHGGKHEVSAIVERLGTTDIQAVSVPLVPSWLRLTVDPAVDQQLGYEHRNSTLTMRPLTGNTTVIRIYDPTLASNRIWFGVDNQGAGETLITSEDADPPPTETTPLWPTGLPLPDAGFRLEEEAPVARFITDSEHSRQTLRFDSLRESYSVTWTFTEAQLTEFQTFFFEDLVSGSKQVSIPLPVDGAENAVAVRFDGGYTERWTGLDRFEVSANLVRAQVQSETPSSDPVYALLYYPVEEVTAHRLVLAADAGKMFEVYAALGETVNLHIGPGLIEFGVLPTGPGDVLITRTPFLHDFGSDEVTSEILAPDFSLESVIVDLGEFDTDAVTSEILAPSFEIVSLLVDLGELDPDAVTSEILTTSLELKEVLVETSPPSDETTSEILKPSFALEVP